MPEYLKVLDEQGRPLDVRKTKAEVLRDGDWREVIHVWVVDQTNQLLVQRRSIGQHARGIFDGLWDASVGGGVQFGEDSRQCAARETAEELGLRRQLTDFEFLGRYQIPPKTVGPGRVMKDFSDDYLLRVPALDKAFLGQLTLQSSEVKETAIVQLKDFREQTQEPDFAAGWVPHGAAYYVGISERILSL